MMTMPVLEMLRAYRKSNPLSFHMPGHILGRFLPEEIKAAGSLDITEIPGSDCLHNPTGIIRDAQMLASRCFGAEYSIFLVNGSTAGIHAMIQATVKPEGKIILGRDCHISALNALALLNADPVFVTPEMDDESQIPLGVTRESLEKALSARPDAQGILVTRPGYYGTAAPIEGISEITKRQGIVLMIDEAHGAHFKFHEGFPDTALELGADLCVQSLHKTLPALTQTALLHGSKNSIIERRAVETTVSMVQTTSPSYLFMASIDFAREIMENRGRELYEELRNNIRRFEGKLAQRTVIFRVAADCGGFETDFSRIVLSFDNTVLNGYQAEEVLRTEYGIAAEMADFRNIVLIATPFHTFQDFDKLSSALESISREYRGARKKSPVSLSWPWTIPERVVPLRQALFHKGAEVPIEKTKGLISAAFVIPYPPGIPLLNPGERITRDIIDYITMLLKEKCPVNGIKDGRIRVLSND